MNPKKDLYLSVNDEWIKSAKIPEGRSALNAFSEIDLKTEEILTKEIDNIIQSSETFELKPLNEFIKLYKMALDTKTREKNKTHNMSKFISYINGIKDFKTLNQEYFHLLLNDFETPISFFVYTDMKNSTKNCLYIHVADTFLPDKSYYLDNEKYEKYISKFKEFNLDLLNEFMSKEETEKHLLNAIKFDKDFSQYIKTSEERANYVDMYNERSLEEIYSYSKFVDIKNILHQIGAENSKVVITEPVFFENLNKFVNEENFENILSWMLVRFIIKNSHLFTEEIRIKGLKFSNFLKGIDVPLEMKKFYYNKISSYYSEIIGIYYAQKYFGEESKKDVLDMTKKMIAMYQKRLSENTWLNKETKQKAIDKLNKIEVLIGYPDNYRKIYDKLFIKENLCLFENVTNLNRLFNLESFKKLKKDVDKKEWGMSADTVNAYYSPTNNLICFPAAILQAPFYSIKQSKSANYGGIGAVIAHEISHAFDNNGARCDENGNINNWWKEDDFKNFEKLTNLMIEQWDGLETTVGKVNGKLTVSENIADNGGLACSLAVLKTEKDYNLEEFFKNWARVWRMVAKEEYQKLLLETDVHSPGPLRANITVKNFDEFYETFNIDENDNMYLPKEKRIIIW